MLPSKTIKTIDESSFRGLNYIIHGLIYVIHALIFVIQTMK